MTQHDQTPSASISYLLLFITIYLQNMHTNDNNNNTIIIIQNNNT